MLNLGLETIHPFCVTYSGKHLKWVSNLKQPHREYMLSEPRHSQYSMLIPSLISTQMVGHPKSKNTTLEYDLLTSHLYKDPKTALVTSQHPQNINHMS